MFLFCLGTIPLMFALGAASSALSGAKGQTFSRRVMQTGAALVAALGLVMFSNGWITVQQGIPVRWTIKAPPGSITGCNNSIIIREYGIQYDFKPGDNVIKFTPAKTGRFRYSCWMGMIQSTITVLAKGEGESAAR